MRVIGKGNKERLVYLNEACLQALALMRTAKAELKNIKDTNALFISKRTGKRLSVRRIQQIVEQCLLSAGLDEKGYSVHKLRHTAATLLYRYSNADMLSLKEILGHAHVSTTEIYTHMDSASLKEIAHSSPLSNVTANPPKDEKTGNTTDKNDKNN